MAAEPLVLEHSIDADVSLAFAWKFRTDVANWSDPLATFALDGAFTDGSQGITTRPGQPPMVWWIRDVLAERSFAIEIPLDRATLRFEWSFEAVTAGTKLTQRILISGANAMAYRQQVETAFGATLVDGMRRIAADMVAAERASK
jgi:hypothetical protein